jgi:hypothetical protein
MSEVKVEMPVLRGVRGKKQWPTDGIPPVGILWIPYRQAIVMCLPTWCKGAIQLWLRERHLLIRSSRLTWPSSVNLWCLELESAFKEDVCFTGSRQVEGRLQAPWSCTQQSPDRQTYKQLQQRMRLPHQTQKTNHSLVTSSDEYGLTHLIHRMLPRRMPSD